MKWRKKSKEFKDTGSEITSEEENFYNRVELTSSSRVSYKNDNQKNSFKKFNINSCWGEDKINANWKSNKFYRSSYWGTKQILFF